MNLSIRISTVVRSVIASRCDDLPNCRHFVFRPESALFSPIHNLRRERHERLCERVVEGIRQAGLYDKFAALDIGDENSAGFREIFDFIVAHLDDFAYWMKVVLSVVVLLMAEREPLPDYEGVPLTEPKP